MTKPTDDITWDSNGTHVTTTPGTLKTDGFAANDVVVSAYENYWRKGMFNWKTYFENSTDILISTTSGVGARVAFNLESVTHGQGSLAVNCFTKHKNYIYAGLASGHISRSSDYGATWSTMGVVSAGNINGLTSNGNILIAADGTNGIYSSSNDGTTWTQRDTFNGLGCFDVIFTNSIFIAVGQGSQIKTSTDGITWTSQASAGVNSTTGAVWVSSLSLYVVIGDHTIQTSPDAITWTLRYTAPGSLSRILYSSILGKLIVCGVNGSVFSSSDGITWISNNPISGAGTLLGLVTTNEGLVVFYSQTTGMIYWSADLVNYAIQQTIPSSSTSRGLSYIDGVFYIGASAGVLYRADSFHSFRLQMDFVNANKVDKLAALKMQVGHIQATTTTNNFLIYDSAFDGQTWWALAGAAGNIGAQQETQIPYASNSSVSGGSTTFNGMCWDSTNSLFIAVGAVTGGAGVLYTSPNTGTWTSRTSNSTAALNRVFNAVGLSVAVGASSTIITSTNGTTWTSRTAANNATNDVCYGNGIWVAVGPSGLIQTSANGTTGWTARTSNTAQNLNGICYSSALGLFCAVGGARAFVTSPDGITWTASTISPSVASGSVNYIDVAASDLGFLAVGALEQAVSVDGVTWNTSLGMDNVTSVTYGANSKRFMFTQSFAIQFNLTTGRY